MKHNKLFLTAGILTAMMMGSCVGDLDLKPTDPRYLTPDQFASDPAKYLDEAIAGVYLQYAAQGANGNSPVSGFDDGMVGFQRSAFTLEQIPTDEAAWMSAQDPDLYNLQFGTIAANNTAILGTYSRFMVNIAMCNQFIQTVNAGYFNLASVEGLTAKADEYIRQAKILRAGAYFYAIDCFGNVPWADETVDMGVVAPQLSTDFATGRRLVYEQNVNNLEEIVAWYKANDPNNVPPYGYVGLDVAESLLVKYYLNAEVYAGEPAWDKCLEHAQAVISRLGKGGYNGSGLCESYFQNFSFNNHPFALGNTESNINEIIWVIPQQNASENGGLGVTAWGNSSFMCEAWLGQGLTPDDDPNAEENQGKVICDPKSEYNTTSAWQCMAARTQFVEVFDWDDATMATSPDKRVSFWKTSKDRFVANNPSLLLADWGKNGYLAIKYTNWAINNNGDIDLEASLEPTDQFSGDYAVIRLAEIYLSAAEAILHGAGSVNDALTYVNYIRERAGLAPYTSIDLGELQNERQRELYTENIRRSDLVRYGKWVSGYNWNWKNNVAEGSDFVSSFAVYPIPSTLAARNGYVQNPGY